MRPKNPMHKLERVTLRVYLPNDASPNAVTTSAEGWAPTKRGHLWHVNESWSSDERSPGMMEPADWIHHLALVAMQDRPNTPERLDFALTGGLGYQDPLWPI